MSNMTTIELFKENMDFAAGHFTIFSATRREKLHGHNFQVHASFDAIIREIGMAFDYVVYKEVLRKLCKQLDHYFLLPTQSPYLRIEEEGDYYQVYFHDERIPFLKKDVLLLPLRNITVEELSKWFVDCIVADQETINKYAICSITIKVFSAPGQGATASWKL